MNAWLAVTSTQQIVSVPHWFLIYQSGVRRNLDPLLDKLEANRILPTEGHPGMLLRRISYRYHLRYRISGYQALRATQ